MKIPCDKIVIIINYVDIDNDDDDDDVHDNHPHLPVLAPHDVEAEAASLLVEDNLP